MFRLSNWYMVPNGMKPHGNQLCLLPAFDVGSASKLLYQHCNDKDLFLDQTDIISNKIVIFQSHVVNNIPVLQKPIEVTKWKGNNFLADLTWVERHNRIGRFLLTKDIALADIENRVKWPGTIREYWVTWQCTADNLYTSVIIQNEQSNLRYYEYINF